MTTLSIIQYSGHPVIKSASPLFLKIICLGGTLALVAVGKSQAHTSRWIVSFYWDLCFEMSKVLVHQPITVSQTIIAVP